VSFGIIYRKLTGRMVYDDPSVYRMISMGPTFMCGLICALESLKTYKPKTFSKHLGFSSPGFKLFLKFLDTLCCFYIVQQ